MMNLESLERDELSMSLYQVKNEVIDKDGGMFEVQLRCTVLYGLKRRLLTACGSTSTDNGGTIKR